MKAKVERINKALEADNSIVISRSELTPENLQMFAKPQSYFESLGMRKSDLTFMERHGQAIRLRTYNGQLEFPKIKDAKGVEREFVTRNFMGGSKVRWILLAPEAA